MGPGREHRIAIPKLEGILLSSSVAGSNGRRSVGSAITSLARDGKEELVGKVASGCRKMKSA
jgi:hypothetical protein